MLPLVCYGAVHSTFVWINIIELRFYVSAQKKQQMINVSNARNIQRKITSFYAAMFIDAGK